MALSGHDETARRVLAALADRNGTVIGSPTFFPTDSSHSVFYVADAEIGQVLVKLVVDDFLAVGTPPLLQEYRALAVASAAGLSPAPLHLSIRDRALVQQFLPWPSSRDWSTPGLRSGIRLAAALMLVPNACCGLVSAHLDLDADLRSSQQILAAATDSDLPLARAVASAVLSLMPRISDYCRLVQPELDLLPLVLSHNDISPENTIGLADRALLVDFEMAALGRPDFVYGQLAVDALLEDALAGRASRPVAEVWSEIDTAVPYRVGERLRWARVAERLVQNIAYGLRQLIGHGPSFNLEYLERKAAVARHGAAMLTSVCSWWPNSGEAAWS